MLALDANSLRVLGCLMEKEMTTPDLYPLSVNALVNACNQRSSRDPVMDLGEDGVRTALDPLIANDVVAAARDSGRVARFEHRIRTVLQLRRDETAILCLLLLRGPQTPGELRSRSDRMFAFDDLAQLQAALERMAARDEPLLHALPRAPGSREIRYAHRLGNTADAPPPQPAAANNDANPALESLRDQVEALTWRVSVLEARLERGDR